MRLCAPLLVLPLVAACHTNSVRVAGAPAFGAVRSVFYTDRGTVDTRLLVREAYSDARMALGTISVDMGGKVIVRNEPDRCATCQASHRARVRASAAFESVRASDGFCPAMTALLAELEGSPPGPAGTRELRLYPCSAPGCLDSPFTARFGAETFSWLGTYSTTSSDPWRLFEAGREAWDPELCDFTIDPTALQEHEDVIALEYGRVTIGKKSRDGRLPVDARGWGWSVSEHEEEPAQVTIDAELVAEPCPVERGTAVVGPPLPFLGP